MGKIRDLPLGTYPNGTRVFGPYAFAGGVDRLGFSVGRATPDNPAIWSDAATTLTFDVQFSLDGGVTYTAPGTWVWTQNGGMLIDSHTGLAIPESRVSWRFNPEPLTHIRGAVTVAGGPVYTYLDIDGA